MLIIPTTTDPDSRLQILLGANLLTLRTYWNETAGAWYMDISDANSVSVTRGLLLVDGINVLGAEPELVRTLGQFRMILLDNVPAVTFDNFGTSARLWWFAPGEWEAAEMVDTVLTLLPFDVATMYTIDPKLGPKRLRFDGSWTFNGEMTYNGLDPRP